MAAKVKRTHRYAPELQRQFMEFAERHGDTNETTQKMQQVFRIPQTVAYYYRRKAFGYRDGEKLPVKIQVESHIYDILKCYQGYGGWPTIGDVVYNLILHHHLDVPIDGKEDVYEQLKHMIDALK